MDPWKDYDLMCLQRLLEFLSEGGIVLEDQVHPDCDKIKGSHLTIKQLTHDGSGISLTVMARPLRMEKLGGWYHVTARGNERKAIFHDDADRRHFLEIVAEMVRRFQLRLHCFVFMDNHYHLLLELREPNLSRAVQWLNVSYSVGRNENVEALGLKALQESKNKTVLSPSAHLPGHPHTPELHGMHDLVDLKQCDPQGPCMRSDLVLNYSKVSRVTGNRGEPDFRADNPSVSPELPPPRFITVCTIECIGQVARNLPRESCLPRDWCNRWNPCK